MVAHSVNVFENNAWAWASSVATFTCAFVAVALAVIAGTKAGRPWVLAGALAFMSLDDLIMIMNRSVPASVSASSTCQAAGGG